MGVELREFRIRRLHGTRNFRIPFVENRVVLAGLNGLGKTTVMTMLYYALSGQVRRLLDFKFEALELHFSSRTVGVAYEEIRAAYFAAALRRMRDLFPAEVTERFQRSPELFSQLLSASAESADTYRRLGRTLDLPPGMVERLAEFVQFSMRDTSEEREQLIRKTKAIADLVNAHIVYLPTYRRIERDLREIFPAAEDQLRRRRRLSERPSPRPHFIELVEFGMEDVDETFHRTEEDLKEAARAGLNSLVGTYLRTVIRGEVQEIQYSGLEQFNESTVDRILNRVEEHTLSNREKEILRSDIARWRSDPSHAHSADAKYTAHFFSQLVALDRALTDKEKPVVAFRDVCNGYLRGKVIVYDERNYTIGVTEEGVGALQLRDLSSGEKQIVSLFSHLYLDKHGPYVVLIDEPELSLSVDWQRRLLPDILATGRCALLAATTHSPFIFENELDSAAKDLGECVELAV